MCNVPRRPRNFTSNEIGRTKCLSSTCASEEYSEEFTVLPYEIRWDPACSDFYPINFNAIGEGLVFKPRHETELEYLWVLY